ncbi:MAG: serine/threonine-protein kinase [Bradymonadia bacterium]
MSITGERYQLLERIGHGGMAVVHRAHDAVLERTVALKVLHPHLAERADSRARFAREAKAVARLKHPNIVEVFDYASASSDKSFIVTEFVDGPTLRDFAELSPPRFAESALLLILPVVEAIAKAHEAGIIHRDVKPENIMLRKDGSPVLMDFGIAQMVDMPTLTATGTMLGSPAHMAPEVIDGTDIGAPADIFSIGTTLYWLISGSLPFTGPNPSALFRRILETEFVPLIQRRPAAGRDICQLVQDCLVKDQASRPTATTLSTRIRAILKASDITQLSESTCSFVLDPHGFEASLPERLLPAFLRRATTALEAGELGACIDALDRVFAIEPTNSDAKRLFAKIERKQALKRNLIMAAIITFGLSPLFIGGYLFLDTSMGQRILAGTPDVITTLDASVSGSPQDAANRLAQDLSADTLVDGTLDAKLSVSDAAPSPVADVLDRGAKPASRHRVRFVGSHKAVRVLLNGQPHQPASFNRIKRDGGLNLPSGRHRISLMKRGCKPLRYTLRLPRPDGSIPTVSFKCKATSPQRPSTQVDGPVAKDPSQLITVDVRSTYKGARLIVDGQKDPRYLYQIGKSGLKLTPGRHTVVFENKGCEPSQQTLNLVPGAGRRYSLIFRCKALPAILRVATNGRFRVLDDKDTFIGMTNENIKVPLKNTSQSVRLTIGSPSGTVRRQVVLRAGQQTSLRID